MPAEPTQSPEAVGGENVAARPSKGWQPFTFRGVAAFSWSRFRRLFLVQLLFSQIASLTVLWFVISCWVPMIESTFEKLPERGEIRSGAIYWENFDIDESLVLAENRFASFSLGYRPGQTSADLQLSINRDDFLLCSLAGCISLPFPEMKDLKFDRLDVAAGWETYKIIYYLALWGGVTVLLFFSWWILATLYALPMWLFSFFGDKECSFGGAWKLASAALLPGAFWMAISIGLYAFRLVDLLGLLLAFLVHFVIGWVYLFGGYTRLPLIDSFRKTNPFS